MKVFQVENRYRQISGGIEVVVDQTIELLRKNGIETKLIEKSSIGLDVKLKGKRKALINGFYSLSSFKLMTELIKNERPDIVHVHNLYPLFSPSILVACKKARVPVVLTCHSFYFVCPTTFHFRDGNICELCCGNKEYWCILKNCRHDIFESTAYALRTMFARKLRLFKNNVTLFIALTEFSKTRLVNAGFDENKIAIVPNAINMQHRSISTIEKNYIAFAGRLSPEKGVDILLAAAAKLSHIPVKIAGGGPSEMELKNIAPKNVEFLGLLGHEQLNSFYCKARFLVFPSICFEMFPMVILEAMKHRLPVIASRIGGLMEIVDDGITGLLFEPGSVEDLVKKMNFLWSNQKLCDEIGEAANTKLRDSYTSAAYFKNLMSVYKKAILINSS